MKHLPIFEDYNICERCSVGEHSFKSTICDYYMRNPKYAGKVRCWLKVRERQRLREK